MLNMQEFHESLFASSARPNPYLQALKAFTSLSLARLRAMTTGLGWEPW